jgi:hypothetical protein
MASALHVGVRSTRRGPAVGAPRALSFGSPMEDAETAGAFGAVYRRMEPAEGERRLLLAVLEDGIRTLLKHAGATRGRARTLQREALTWLLSDAHTDVFAFASICEALEIDPGRLRGQVMARVRPAQPVGGLSS